MIVKAANCLDGFVCNRNEAACSFVNLFKAADLSLFYGAAAISFAQNAKNLL